MRAQERELGANFGESRNQRDKKRVNKELGRDPTLTKLKINLANKQMIEFATKRQWGHYRNCILNIALTLEKEGNLKDALKSIFEVCYLDSNGPNNVMIIDGNAMSYEESEKRGIKDFDPEMAFFAPAPITWIRKWTASLNLSDNDTKALFIEVNKRTKPFDKMPVNPKEAWEHLKKRIEEDRKIDSTV